MNWLRDIVGRLYGSTAIENALLRSRLRALEDKMAEQNTLLDIQIKMFAHVVPRDKLPPWLQVNLHHEEAVENPIPDGSEEVVEGEIEDVEEGDEEEGEDEGFHPRDSGVNREPVKAARTRPERIHFSALKE
jgi:hypothetical protein